MGKSKKRKSLKALRKNVKDVIEAQQITLAVHRMEYDESMWLAVRKLINGGGYG